MLVRAGASECVCVSVHLGQSLRTRFCALPILFITIFYYSVTYHGRAGGALQWLLPGRCQGQDAGGEQLLLGHQFQGEGVIS